MQSPFTVLQEYFAPTKYPT